MDADDKPPLPEYLHRPADGVIGNAVVLRQFALRAQPRAGFQLPRCDPGSYVVRDAAIQQVRIPAARGRKVATAHKITVAIADLRERLESFYRAL